MWLCSCSCTSPTGLIILLIFICCYQYIMFIRDYHYFIIKIKNYDIETSVGIPRGIAPEEVCKVDSFIWYFPKLKMLRLIYNRLYKIDITINYTTLNCEIEQCYKYWPCMTPKLTLKLNYVSVAPRGWNLGYIYIYICMMELYWNWNLQQMVS